MRICAGIVTYNPDIERLKENIDAVKSQVDKIFLIDNASNNIVNIQILTEISQTVLIKNTENLGIAKALNQLCERACQEGYESILTLDQDSVVPEGMVLELAKYAGRTVAIVAPDIVYRNNENLTGAPKDTVDNVEWVITSASLTNLAVWKEIGGFDEKLFIDGVDRDYCIRAGRAGFSIIKNRNAQLLHELGNLKCRKLFGRTIYVTNHSPFRYFYMARNALYLDNKLGLNAARKTIVKLILKILFYESCKLEKFQTIFKGVREAKNMSLISKEK